MQDVANLARVSRTTVSFVINRVDDGAIPAETQQRVWDAVAELGYRPNAAARNLRMQRTHTLGFISDHIATTPFAGQMIQGAQDFAWEHGKLILLINTGGRQNMKNDAAEALLERQVEGILYASMYHRAVTPPASLREVPTVLLDSYVADRSLPSVVPDEMNGARVAVEHLIAHGHSRIGMITNVDPIPATTGREKGFHMAMRNHALPIDKSLIVAAQSDQAGGYGGGMQILQCPNRPTALFCFNDRMAMGVYQAAAELGLRIPADVAIVGFDNQEVIAPSLRPALTTMQLPHYAMGRWAAEHLLQLITSGINSNPIQQMLECPLIERSSV